MSRRFGLLTLLSVQVFSGCASSVVFGFEGFRYRGVVHAAAALCRSARGRGLYDLVGLR
jgi:hypothetical protein